jgi:Ca2+/H+ antiporter, TMEM165/GDT1 family
VTLMFRGWMQLGPSALAGFLASSVECVEALTIILAVAAPEAGARRSLGPRPRSPCWPPSLACSARPWNRFRWRCCKYLSAGLLLIFGMRWLRKSILRFAGIIPLHDEDAAFAAEQRRLGSGSASPGWDVLALATTFQITMLEGAEVVFIVLGIGAGGPKLTEAASVGALLALLVTAIIGAVVHRPLANVPENLLKFIVGILLTAFGTFWFGEGAGISWPGEDVSLVGLTLCYFFVAVVTIRLCREGRRNAFDVATPETGR